jgi:HD-like signal output (HDOD) protein/GGDEF domain-containing protein
VTETTLKSALPDVLAQAENLPSMPGVAAEILQLTERGEEVGLDEFSPVLEKDPALAARLLKLANSAAYNTGNPADTIEQATAVLGMNTLQTMALSFILVDNLPKRNWAGSFDFGEYWRRSVTGAVAARSFARITGRCAENHAFLCGLFGSLGRLVLAMCLPEQYEKVLASAGHPWPSHSQEEKVIGFNHCDVGAALLAEWNLPEWVVTCVGYMSRPDAMPSSTPPDIVTLVEHMHLANLTAEVLAGTDRAKALVELTVAAKWRDVSPRMLTSYIINLEQDLHETAELLQVDLPKGPDHLHVLHELREELARQMSQRAAGDAVEGERRAQLDPGHLPLPDGPEDTDERTGLASADFFERIHRRELDALRGGKRVRALGLLQVDVDGWSSIVKGCGKKGEAPLVKEFGEWMKRTMRVGDLCAYLGKGRFGVMIGRATPATLQAISDRICAAARSFTPDSDGSPQRITVSVAGACAARCAPDTGPDDLWRTVRVCMLECQTRGGDCSAISPQLRLEGRRRAA